MFQSSPTGKRETRLVLNDSIEARLHALGVVLDTYEYTGGGLCILTAEGGFIVHGLRVVEHRLGYAVGPRTVTVEDTEIAATLARLSGD